MPRIPSLALVVGALLGATLLLSAADADKKDGPTKAVCLLTALKGSHVAGAITFTQKGDSVQITGEITGLTPGEHGFHVHQFGDLSSNDGMSTGPHFDPDMMMHGGPHAASRHVGDLGNITADENGKARINITDKHITLSGPHSIIGRGLIVHAKADDLKSQPAGNAGDRIGGGVIGVAKP
jgi:Cu-Zn family superoxide dismutase